MVSLSSTRLTLLLSFVLLVCICQETSAVQKICGNALTELLDTLCGGASAKKILNKKSVLPALPPADYETESEEEDSFGFKAFPFLEKLDEGVADFITKTRRRRQGVADQCCGKGCSYYELARYCADYTKAVEIVNKLT